MIEVWKIVDTVGRIKWSVSNYGHVKKDGISYTCNKCSGYFKFCDYFVHHAVYQLFGDRSIDRPYQIIYHIDGDKLNNCIMNLDIIDRAKFTSNQFRGIKHWNCKLSEIDIELILLWKMKNFSVKKIQEMILLGRGIQISARHIYRILSGERRGQEFKKFQLLK